MSFLRRPAHKLLSHAYEGACGRAEGIVARTTSRNAIAKLRFEDYERHAKRRIR